MTPQAYLYICDGDIDHPVLTHKKMDWPEKYPHWQEIPLVMAQPDQERVEWGVDWNKDGSCVSIIKRLPDGGIEVVAIEYGPQHTWASMTEDEVDQGLLRTGYAMKTAEAWRHGVEWAQFNLMRKNT